MTCNGVSILFAAAWGVEDEGSDDMPDECEGFGDDGDLVDTLEIGGGDSSGR